MLIKYTKSKKTKWLINNVHAFLKGHYFLSIINPLFAEKHCKQKKKKKKKSKIKIKRIWTKLIHDKLRNKYCVIYIINILQTEKHLSL